MKRSITVAALLAATAVPLSAHAQLANYGYVVGTFVPGSNFIEPISQQGTFLHYHFRVQVQNGPQYEVVVDIKNGHVFEFPYRIVPLRPSNASYYGSIFSATSGYHSIPMVATGGTAASGALDYIRHPGILRDLAGRPWSYTVAQPTANPDQFTLPSWDQLFVGVTKIIAFGAPYTTGTGVHTVHQNQGDQNPSFIGSNGTFQDGGVIFEYAPNAQGPVRKLLMTRFDDQPAYNGNPASLGQTDFSYTTDPDGPGPLHVGQYAPFTEIQYSYDSGPTGTPALYGPFFAEQFEVITGSEYSDDCLGYHDVDVYVGHDSTVTNTNYDQFSAYNGCTREFVRSYNGSKQNFYTYVRPWVVPSGTYVTFRYR